MVKKVFQTSPAPPEQKNINFLMSFLDEWEYIHFTDNQVIDFFIDNPIQDFPNPEVPYSCFESGAHRTDFFRYYFLYLNGGLFLDSDLMLYSKIDEVLFESELVTCQSIWEDSAYQGFLYSEPRHPVIYEALMGMYNLNRPSPEQARQHYHSATEEFLRIIKKSECDIAMLEEKMFYYWSETKNKECSATIISAKDKPLAIHWQEEKTIYQELGNKIIKGEEAK